MKVFISFEPNKKLDNFEGSRLRKTTKGALDINNVGYVSEEVEGSYDLVHLISYEDTPLLERSINNNIPVVVSALMCETDKKAAYLDFKYHDGEITYILCPKAKNFLNKANKVIVPTEGAKELLIDKGVTSDIEVIMPGINLSRFDFTRTEEKELFFRYFREDRNKKLVVAVGDYDNFDGINAFLKAAEKCPEALFYFFGQTKNLKRVPYKIKKTIKNAPKNAKFKEIVADDIYRSALLNATIFMIPEYRYVGVMSILEAMAAKCEIIAREQSLLPGILEDQETAHIAQFSETLVVLVRDVLDGKLRKTAFNAYQKVQDYSIEKYGEELSKLYKEIIEKN